MVKFKLLFRLFIEATKIQAQGDLCCEGLSSVELCPKALAGGPSGYPTQG